MSEFEKAELLKERANVSFEEARDALRACDGRLADAFDMIERRKRAAADLEARRAAERAASATSCDDLFGEDPSNTPFADAPAHLCRGSYDVDCKGDRWWYGG